MNIAVLGGSFDPPHNGHAKIADLLLTKLQFHHVWLVPCLRHPFQKELSGTHHRLAMTKLLETTNIKVSDYEINTNNTSYSIDTLEGFSKLFPDDSFYWTIGSDQLNDFPKWKRWQDIIAQHGLIIVQRGNVENGEKKVKEIIHVDTISNNILFLSSESIPNTSSTMIREKMQHGESIIGFVPPAVESYIAEHSLYK